VWYRQTFEIFLRFVCQTTLTISVPLREFFRKSILNNFKRYGTYFRIKLETIFDFSVVLQ